VHRRLRLLASSGPIGSAARIALARWPPASSDRCHPAPRPQRSGRIAHMIPSAALCPVGPWAAFGCGVLDDMPHVLDSPEVIVHAAVVDVGVAVHGHGARARRHTALDDVGWRAQPPSGSGGAASRTGIRTGGPMPYGRTTRLRGCPYGRRARAAASAPEVLAGVQATRWSWSGPRAGRSRRSLRSWACTTRSWATGCPGAGR